MHPRTAAAAMALLHVVCVPHARAAIEGYYREPALHGDTLVFVAEDDLWKVGVRGGIATRLTTHPGRESTPAISTDGATLAFVGGYEGPSEVYTMPMGGGLPVRRTWGAEDPAVAGWTPAGEVLYSTEAYSTLPNTQLVRLDVQRSEGSGVPSLLPLAQAADGSFEPSGRTLFFTRLAFQGSHTKRYRGGTAQKIWRFTTGEPEAVPLTEDYPGTSKEPMWWRGRVYFVSDRDGTMNLWSMDERGGNLEQHTRHAGWEVRSPSLEGGRIAYQLGADLHVLDLALGQDRRVPITLESDLDQTREHWVDRPFDYLTSAHVSPDGDRIVLTARGRIFVAPRGQGRLVEASRAGLARYREARFFPDGRSLLALSDESGEVELWKLPANGVGPSEQLTTDSEVLRWEGVPSPDGKWVAHHDKNQRLYALDLARKQSRLIDESHVGDFDDLAWSADGKWLAYVVSADNLFVRVRLWSAASGRVTDVTTDRFDSYSPAWSPDGKWLYLLSDRNLKSVVGSPWGSRQPEPFLDKTTEIYQIALTEDLRSPFAPDDELHPDDEEESEGHDLGAASKDEKETGKEKGKEKGKKKGKGQGKDNDEKDGGVKPVKIDLEGIRERLVRVPVKPGNYSALAVNDSALFWLSRDADGSREGSTLLALEIDNEDFDPEEVAGKVRSYELSPDGKKLMLVLKEAIHVVDAKAEEAELEKKVDLAAWKLSVVPRQEWRQMFVESWRLERDYFYDRGMHGVDWKGTLDKYLPLVDRVTTRRELSDLMAQMVSELAALHIFVNGGDLRSGKEQIEPASLGAVLVRDAPAGGFRVEHVYRSDPDRPERASPLARPGVGVKDGDVIERIDGVSTLSVPDVGTLLRNRAGRQTLLGVKPKRGASRDVIVQPISLDAAQDLRYHEWEYTRRQEVEQRGEARIGYVHLRAMGGDDYTAWAEGYYPAFDREGLIVDVRHNRGGNIDSWILSRLLRKAWFYWSQRVGRSPVWNMQYAFRGHVAVLCDEHTASDGEAFSEGIKRLGIGKLFGTRTWGGEIWLSSSNRLVDRGIATAAEFGVYGPEGEWLIEGHGVEPDVVVDNLPHATFEGRDAQLEAAIDYLKRRIAEEPVPAWDPPKHPNKSFDYGAPR